MTIEQTVTIPDDRRVSLEFLAPQEIPTGKARIELKVIPFPVEKDTASEDEKKMSTPITDSLLGILSHLGDISLEQIKEERLARYLK